MSEGSLVDTSQFENYMQTAPNAEKLEGVISVLVLLLIGWENGSSFFNQLYIRRLLSRACKLRIDG